MFRVSLKMERKQSLFGSLKQRENKSGLEDKIKVQSFSSLHFSLYDGENFKARFLLSSLDFCPLTHTVCLYMGNLALSSVQIFLSRLQKLEVLQYLLFPSSDYALRNSLKRTHIDVVAGTTDPLGKRLNNSKTRAEIGWEPKYPSFSQFLNSL